MTGVAALRRFARHSQSKRIVNDGARKVRCNVCSASETPGSNLSGRRRLMRRKCCFLAQDSHPRESGRLSEVLRVRRLTIRGPEADLPLGYEVRADIIVRNDCFGGSTQSRASCGHQNCLWSTHMPSRQLAFGL
jgi:hypothetical protein